MPIFSTHPEWMFLILVGLAIFALLATPAFIIGTYSRWLDERPWRRTVHFLVAEAMAIFVVIAFIVM